MRSSKVVTILLVEDDEIDVKALRWAFEKLKIANPLVIARDGVDAWEKLPELPRPYLVITDINMPRMNGIELLRKIRQSEEYRDSIVFVLTTSNDEQDKIDAYQPQRRGLHAEVRHGHELHASDRPDRELLEGRRVSRPRVIDPGGFRPHPTLQYHPPEHGWGSRDSGQRKLRRDRRRLRNFGRLGREGADGEGTHACCCSSAARTSSTRRTT